MRLDIVNAALEEELQQQCSQLTPPLMEVCQHALRGGRRTRANILLLASASQDERSITAAAALEMLHAATLLQDDIFDGSDKRRGLPAAHVQFGKAQAMLASDWLLVHSLELAAEIDEALFRQWAESAKTMAKTVAAEMFPPELHTVSAAEEYILNVARGKTGVLFALALYAAARFRQESVLLASQWSAVGMHVGCAYQLMDDCVDAYASAACAGKCVSSDLSTGRLTMPSLLACQTLIEKGFPMPLAKLQRAQLNPCEMGALQAELSSETVQAALRSRLAQMLSLANHAAERAGIAAAAIDCWTADISGKLQSCFGGNNVARIRCRDPLRHFERGISLGRSDHEQRSEHRNTEEDGRDHQQP